MGADIVSLRVMVSDEGQNTNDDNDDVWLFRGSCSGLNVH